MNYAKHYSGNVAAATTGTHYYINADGTASSTSAGFNNGLIVRETIIGEALETFLKECGLANCKYYGTVSGKPISYLCLDDTKAGKPGFYIYIESGTFFFLAGFKNSTAYIAHGGRTTSNSTYMRMYYALSSSWNPFSATGTAAGTYDFYIRIRGDVKSSFNITISKYGTTTFLDSAGMCVANLIDKRTNREAFGYSFATAFLSTLGAVYKDTNHDVIETNTSNNTITSLSSGAKCNIVDGFVTLINKFISNYSYLFFVDGFFKPTEFTALSFYEIDGDEYFVEDTGMYKCTTPTPS